MKDEPSKLSDLLTAYMARARERAKLAECPDHPGLNAMTCTSCAADRLAAGALARQEWAKTAAMAKCDELFPRRYRDAQPSESDVNRWVSLVAKDIESAPSLLLLGPTGTGKTYQAYGALRAALLARPKSTWTTSTFPDFAAALRPRAGVETESEMDRFRAADLLLLDDLGTAKGSEWVEEITYRLVNGRYEDMRPTIFTTNLDPDELRIAIGARLAGRLAETCIQVPMEGEDWRRKKAA